MSHQDDSLEKIHSILIHLRQGITTRRKFPQEVWDAIIRLTRKHSIEEVCQHLQLNPAYLRRKIRLSEGSPLLDFREISHTSHSGGFESVVIELSSNSGLKARIQGSVSALNCLHALFKR